MTATELNRGIKKLGKQFGTDKSNTPEYEKEYKRLYYADDDFQYMNKDSVLTMLRINLRHRFIALHSFGINISLLGQ